MKSLLSVTWWVTQFQHKNTAPQNSRGKHLKSKWKVKSGNFWHWSEIFLAECAAQICHPLVTAWQATMRLTSVAQKKHFFTEKRTGGHKIRFCVVSNLFDAPLQASPHYEAGTWHRKGRESNESATKCDWVSPSAYPWLSHLLFKLFQLHGDKVISNTAQTCAVASSPIHKTPLPI